MRWLRSFWFPVVLILGTFVFCLNGVLQKSSAPDAKSFETIYREGSDWVAPLENEIPFTEEGERIRYGKELIAHTAKYLGPKGSLLKISNGMNCQNCHTYAGTQNFGNPFSAVAATYPKYRDRSGQVESIEFRINDCLRRSLNGAALDSQSREMQAMVAYIKWVGKDVPKSIRPKGAGTEEIALLNRAASPQKGKAIYTMHCQRCHGTNGEGLATTNSTEYTYPPLWGPNSYNAGAGIYRLGLLAGFVKNNMPYGINRNSPELTDEEAWDVAAFIASQPRPVKLFPADWKNISKKPYDYPFGPYADSFPARQHKYGPFGPIRKK